ncbi:two-component system sensor histidine kinase NtrB [Desulforapulum autotrophicum]|nr:ATP-binding protein [Desulforapulum autotrophicum]
MDTNDYLLGAIETLKRQIIVISDDYTILASRTKPDKSAGSGQDIKGQFCHSALYNLPKPCANCPVREVIRTGKPTISLPRMDNCTSACLYAYPMEIKENDTPAIVVLDFHLPSLDECDERRIASNAFLRNLIYSAVDGVIAADMTGRILIFNRAATEITGYSKEEAFESLDIRNLYPKGDAHRIMGYLRSDAHGKKGVIRSYKQLALQRDGTTIPISLNASIVYEGDREIATIGFFHDLTGTLRMEAELEKTQTQLLQAEKMSSLGKLAAGVAHQLNNPLGGITLFAQLMLEEHELSDDAKSDLSRIQRDAERCSAIVKELLEFARQTNREVRPHDINTIVSRTLFLLKNQSIFQNIDIVETYDKTLPQIPADGQQLNHVFMNIILNGADAMAGKGRLEIRTGFSADQTMVKIEISDTGPGIDKNLLSTIFEPFFTTKEVGKGTGLGLSMAYGIIESHGGRIWAENREPTGTRFIILLPLKLSKDLTPGIY